MVRVKWKGHYFSSDIIKLILKHKLNLNLQVNKSYIFKKSSIIPNVLNNKIIKIYKGNNFRSLIINLYNIGFRFGNFALTRKPFNYPLKIKKKNNIICKR